MRADSIADRAGSTGSDWTTTRASALALSAYAWCLLLITDVALRAGGFKGALFVLHMTHTRQTNAVAQKAALDGALRALDRARLWYFRRVQCLPSAVVAACVLRALGVRARFVVGTRTLPFSAHAWVTVDGRVVINDRPDLASTYSVLLDDAGLDPASREPVADTRHSRP